MYKYLSSLLLGVVGSHVILLPGRAGFLEDIDVCFMTVVTGISHAAC